MSWNSKPDQNHRNGPWRNSRVPGRIGPKMGNYPQNQSAPSSSLSLPADTQRTSAPSSDFLSFLADSPQPAKGNQKDGDSSSTTTSPAPKLPPQGDHPGSAWDWSEASKLDLKRSANVGAPEVNDDDELGNPDDSNYDTEDSVGDQFCVDATGGNGPDLDVAVSELPSVTDAEFYSNLVFLAILRPSVGPRERRARDLEYINVSDSTTPVGAMRNTELQRDFLDRLCYLVDYKKGGDTITAAALEFVHPNKQAGPNNRFYLQKRDSNWKHVKIWFAANNGIEKEAWDALLWIQEQIKSNQHDPDGTSEESLAQDICDKFIALASCRDQSECCKMLLKHTRPGSHRINTYAKKMRIAGKKVCESLDASQNPTVSKEDKTRVIMWIEDLRHERDRLQLVSKCHSAWYEEPYSGFLRGSQDPKAPPAMRDFAHFVARLGAHRYAALKVAAGIKGLPCFKNSHYQVEFEKLPLQSHRDVPLKRTVSLVTGGSEDRFESDPWKVVHRLSQRYPQDARQLAAGYLAEEVARTRVGEKGVLPYSFADETRRWIEKRRGELVTRYHAELQIATWFMASNASFFNDDPYIACSKGACWFCHQYLKLLDPRGGEKKFVEPARHNEILPGVSFPYTRSDGPAGERVGRRKAQMNEVVLQTIREVLLEQIPEYSKHAQSTSTWMDEMEIRSVV